MVSKVDGYLQMRLLFNNIFNNKAMKKKMKTMKTILLTTALVGMTACQQTVKTIGVQLIPQPLEVLQTKGAFVLTDASSIQVQGKDAKTIATYFAQKMRTATGYAIDVNENKGDIQLVLDAKAVKESEGYILTVTPEGVKVVAAQKEGLFYGMQSFMQLLPAEIENSKLVKNVDWAASCVEVKDAPRFSYRGLMIDACRHFMTVDAIKKQLDVMALFKMNRLHWHLTEDQAWRIEIKKYPKLTEIGSVRTEDDGTVLKGFYTQEEIKDVVAYAKERCIEVIPELELPGHELSAIAAYPELSCRNTKTSPRQVWGVEDVVMCPGKESTFKFLEDVIAEMVPLFPSKYFHIGGDECPKTSWKKCPLCQKRIRQEGLKGNKEHSSEERLQSYVIQRIEKVLNKHGKRLIGWDEILEGGLAPSATVMSWRGEEGGIKAASMNHQVIMTPGSGGLYLDHYQGDSKIEPVAIGGYAPLSKTYAYDPIPQELVKQNKGKYVLGVQANVWAEYLYTQDVREYRTFPRAIAVAEVAWSALKVKDFTDFCKRLNNAYSRLDLHGIHSHVPLPEQPNGSCNTVAFVDNTVVTFKTTRPVDMYYTLDESEPTLNAKKYTAPLTFTNDAVLKIRSILPSGKMSAVRTIHVVKQGLAPAQKLTPKKKGLQVKWTKGDFFTPKALESVKDWKVKYLKDTHKISRMFPMDGNMRNVDHYSAIAEGYLNIPEDGIYYFSSDLSQVHLDGKILIDNTGEVKRYSRKDISIALAKGWHKVKLTFLGHIQFGWPTYWLGGSLLQMRAAAAEKFVGIKEFRYN